MNLTNLGKKYDTDKVTHGFTNVYDELFSNYRNDKFNLLEVGVFYGSSIKMWNEYFPNAQIYAADYYKGVNGNKRSFPDPEKFVREVNNEKNNLYSRISIVNLDQSSENEIIDFCNKCKNENLKFKIILDDGSHLMRDQQLTFFHMFDILEDGGIFVIEDTHTSDDLKGYDVLPDKSNSTKKIFENIKNGDKFKSIYVNNDDKCNLITNSISKIEHYSVGVNSQTTLIYKK